MSSVFPKDFLWGAASASAQVEGAWNEDGKTPSIWDVATAKQVKNGETCHVACDHYHRYKEDVALMKELGLKSYRFSVSWPRVMPEKGKINPKGIEFYVNLVKELRSAGIEPMCTIFHWDLPVWVQSEGGWKNPKIVELFAEYAKVVVDALSNQVSYWMTINEPQCFIMMGNVSGVHAPFRHDFLAMKKLVRHALLAHGAAVKVIREHAKMPPKIGVAMAASCYVPLNETAEGIEKARYITFEDTAGVINNSIYCDPIFLKKAPKFNRRSFSKEDLELIGQPLDFVGVNVYQPINHNLPGKENRPAPDAKRTMLGWIVDGRCLYWTIRFFHERYKLPVMVTENGMANPDEVDADGAVHDAARTEFLGEYLAGVKRAVKEGIPVLGYQHWSIMDNFEWAEGYGPRFGIVHVDYKTQKRTIKDSGYAYAKIIAQNGENL